MWNHTKIGNINKIGMQYIPYIPIKWEKYTSILIQYSHTQLKANVASILANISRVHFGLLVLIIQQKTHETLTSSPLVRHTNPGTHPSYTTGISEETAA